MCEHEGSIPLASARESCQSLVMGRFAKPRRGKTYIGSNPILSVGVYTVSSSGGVCKTLAIARVVQLHLLPFVTNPIHLLVSVKVLKRRNYVNNVHNTRRGA